MKQAWARSVAFRAALVLAVVWVLLRLVVQIWYLSDALSPDSGFFLDITLYTDAAEALLRRQDMYQTPDVIEVYQYSPTYALAFVPFAWLPFSATVGIHTLLHLAAYALLYFWWGRIFRTLGLNWGSKMLAWTLPVWLIFSAFWSDLGYLNIYIITALLATLLIDAVLNERLGWSLVWLSIILQTKPHWAFVAAVPLFLGRWRFFARLAGLSIVIYIAIAGVTMLVVGPEYGWRQYTGYIRTLSEMRQHFPWRGPDAGFLGYNHSVTQIAVYLLGVTPTTLRLATGVKLLLLMPLAVAGIRHVLWRIRHKAKGVPQQGLDWAFVLYLGVFVWLDYVWELSLGIAVFTYLLAILHRRSLRMLAWALFLPYALVDLWQAASYALFGEDVILPGTYILTDFTIYVPLTLMVILTFYALLVKRLWAAPRCRSD